MKVLHIASGDLWAGAEVQVCSLACAQHRQGVQVEVILFNPGELEVRLRQAGVSVAVYDERRYSALALSWRLLRHMQRSRPDVVHTHRHKENVLGSAAARLVGASSLRTVHGRDEANIMPWRLDKRLYRWLDWACGRWLQQRVVAVSEQLADELVVRFPPQRIQVIGNGIDIEGLVEAVAESVELPGQPGRIRIGFVGRLVPVKRIDVFLRAAQRLQQLQPERFEFYVIGDGPQRTLCQQLIQQLELADHVHVLGFRADAAALLARMHLLLMTSDHEGLPMTLLEAMALGVPIVASAVGGVPQALARCGRLVPAQDAEAYADAVLGSLADPAVNQQQVQRASKRVRELYSAERCSDSYVQLYRRLRPDKETSESTSSTGTTRA